MGILSGYEGDMVVSPFPFTMAVPDVAGAEQGPLPDDVLLNVFSFCIEHPCDLWRVALTCKRFAATALATDRSFAAGLDEAAAMLADVCEGRDAHKFDSFSERARNCYEQTLRNVKRAMLVPEDPPKTSYRPGIWCPVSAEWNADHTKLLLCAPEDHNKHYYVPQWLSCLALRFLKPLGYCVDGEMAFLGESQTHFGVFEMVKSVLTVHAPICNDDEYAGYDFALLEKCSQMGILQLFNNQCRPPTSGISPSDARMITLRRDLRILSDEYRRAFFARFREHWMDENDEWLLRAPGVWTGAPVLCRQGRRNAAAADAGGGASDAAAADTGGEAANQVRYVRNFDAELEELEEWEAGRRSRIEEELKQLAQKSAHEETAT